MPQIIENIVTQHAEEAAFLWLLRENAIYAPHYDLKDLDKHDDRVEAHIDGLRVAKEPGWEICKEQLGNEEAGEVFAASVLAFESGRQEWIDTVLEIGSTTHELSRGVVSALGWIPFEKISGLLQPLINSNSPVFRGIGLAAYSIHRKDPGQVLAAAIADEDLLLRARALRAVGELGKGNLLSTVKANLSSDDLNCRFAAACSGLILGEPSSIPVLQEIVQGKGKIAEWACVMALRRMELDRAHGWQRELTSEPDHLRKAVQAIGVIGDPASIPWLIEQMAIPELGRVAGESFSMITGVDIAYDDLEGDWPEGFEAGPTEDPEDDNVEMDPDEDLPWPNPAFIDKWWSNNKHNYQNGMAYLCGKPKVVSSLQEVLKTGYQRQRNAAAIELALRQPGQPLFETRAPGFRQLKILG